MNGGYTRIYPGHGAPTDMSVIARTGRYINDVIPILNAARDSDAGPMTDGGDPRVGIAMQNIQAKYPSYQSNYALGFSTQTYLTYCH